jgi:hypothetical protein
LLSCFHKCALPASIGASPNGLTLQKERQLIMMRLVSLKVAAVDAILAPGSVGLAHDALAKFS